MYGTPIEWPDDIAEKYKPAVLTANIERIVEECKPRAQLAGFNCDEPVCFAIFRKPEEDWEGINRWYQTCSAWTDLYGITLSMAGAAVSCAVVSLNAVLQAK